MSRTLFPSSFGLSFCIDKSVKAIRINAKWGRYSREKSETLTTDKGNPKTVWKRYPMERLSEPVPISEGFIGPWIPSPDQPEVIVKGVARCLGNGSSDWVISLFLINEQEEPKKSGDSAWIFQPELSVTAADQGAAIFCKRALPRDWDKWDPALKAEVQEYDMLYRHNKEFAVGHGVSATWILAEGETERAVMVSTKVVPSYEVAKVEAPTVEENPFLNGLVLDMKELAECTAGDIPAKLEALPTAYTEWIEKERAKVGTLELEGHDISATRSLNRCETASRRIAEGLELLKHSPQAVEAFQFMNRAMWLQRGHSIFSQAIRRNETSDLDDILSKPKNRSWRPFQLAFILLNLPSLTDVHHKDRSHETDAVADLLWYPTGGGKTEAYLGLAAYAMVLRRLQVDIGGRSGMAGVAVLMRYTLRLLTLQQFQRAATLEAISKPFDKRYHRVPVHR